ncbi:MAG: riboflavin synthase [Gemmatimonadetes bacterium]|nr:riboflavin synthase [Gemmatimonadota bacterium]
MFTGIVAAVGEVVSVDPLAQARRIVIAAPAGLLDDVRPGDSIAVDGVCQTVVSVDAERFSIDAIGTTLSRTTLAGFSAGRRVNLELALAFGERLGGHLVQGHVDGTGRVLSIERRDEYVLLDVSLPAEVSGVTVLHGSLTIDGVSLTVNALPGADRAQVALIPYTWEHTNLSRLTVGSDVNLEGDMLGRFVVHHLNLRSGGHS